ncbi:MAG: LysM peptidoglycan-binding domain-containing protein [Thioalkalivibrio sp.]|nr:MAG: LysM peptidoglycan-binding domain-containing protein [Thioalkalivibrio sp.]
MFYARAAARVRQTAVVVLLALGLVACATAPEPAAPEPDPVPEPMAAPEPAPEPVLRPTAPEQYVVQEGDTLWSIANVFLRDPWYWSEIWLVNPQVRNPHVIYPGDVLSIHFVDDRPRVMVDLAPRIRIEELEDEAFPIAALQPFMFRARVVDEETLEQAPYIVAARDERVLFGPGDEVYVRNAPDAEQYDLYQLVRRDRMLVDPVTREELGVATIPVGEAEVLRGGEIATALISVGEREALRGDRLIGFDEDPDLLFDISNPPPGLEGEVILLFDAISQIGTYQAAVINRGEREGVHDGQVFAVWEAGRTAADPVAGRGNEVVQLPEEEVGMLMVFRTFEKVAYGLVIESTRPIREGFKTRHP